MRLSLIVTVLCANSATFAEQLDICSCGTRGLPSFEGFNIGLLCKRPREAADLRYVSERRLMARIECAKILNVQKTILSKPGRVD